MTHWSGKERLWPFQPGLDWRLPTWMDRLVRWTVKSLGFVAFVAVMTSAGCVMFSFELIQKSLAPVGLLLPTLVALFTVAVHESGHVMAARAAGMTVTSVRVGPMQFVPNRKGWRWRKAGQLRTWSGMVLAFPRPEATIRRQRLWMTAGGPLANIVIGSVGGLIGYALLWNGFAALLLTVSAYNMVVGLLNLLPKEGILPSDGLQIIRWLYRVDENDPRLVYQRLVGMSLAGVATDQVAGGPDGGDGWTSCPDAADSFLVPRERAAGAGRLRRALHRCSIRSLPFSRRCVQTWRRQWRMSSRTSAVKSGFPEQWQGSFSISPSIFR